MVLLSYYSIVTTKTKILSVLVGHFLFFKFVFRQSSYFLYFYFQKSEISLYIVISNDTAKSSRGPRTSLIKIPATEKQDWSEKSLNSSRFQLERLSRAYTSTAFIQSFNKYLVRAFYGPNTISAWNKQNRQKSLFSEWSFHSTFCSWSFCLQKIKQSIGNIEQTK